MIQPNFVELEGALLTAAGRVTQVKLQATVFSREMAEAKVDFQQLAVLVKMQQSQISFLANELVLLTRKTKNARNLHQKEIDTFLQQESVKAAALIGKLTTDFNAQMAKMEAESQALIAETKTTGEKTMRALRQSSWSVFNGMIHLADSILDKTVDGWQSTFGQILSGITTAVTVAHAWSAAAAASGNYMQAAIITANAIVMTTAQVQGQAQMAADKRNRDYTGGLMAGNRPW